ncbi:hypothetical protein L6452_43829 [Arctium lappa]|uniref:Uncharacterized protein n=1 Tax=Arctium lappa TaxID=4217 RepID=A0ACB8XEI7_ARCLA|nr:hypothetical protein L6452_43829 [Arctium lappa]
MSSAKSNMNSANSIISARSSHDLILYTWRSLIGFGSLTFGRHAFGRVMNSVVDRFVVRMVTSRLLFVHQLHLRFSYELMLTRDLSSGITFGCLLLKLSVITEQTQSDH